MAGAVLIRPPRPGDGPGLAETQLEAAAHLADLDPSLFRPVPAEGRAERLERTAVLKPAPDTLWQVAEVDGRIVGYVSAVLQRPTDADRRASVRYVGQLRVWISALLVQQAFARRGIATRLMAAAEDWAARRAPSWSCSRPGPTAQSQCQSTSGSGIAAGRSSSSRSRRE